MPNVSGAMTEKESEEVDPAYVWVIDEYCKRVGCHTWGRFHKECAPTEPYHGSEGGNHLIVRPIPVSWLREHMKRCHGCGRYMAKHYVSPSVQSLFD